MIIKLSAGKYQCFQRLPLYLGSNCVAWLAIMQLTDEI